MAHDYDPDEFYDEIDEDDLPEVAGGDCPMCDGKNTVIFDGEIHYCESCKFIFGDILYRKWAAGYPMN